MNSQDVINLNLAMENPWHKEYGAFLMIPAFSTLACCLIPVFHCEQGLSFMAIVPLTAAFSYGHTLAPRKAYYEKGWEKLMDYASFVLGSVKKTLLFTIPTALTSWMASLFLDGYLKELATFFEVATWGLMSGICLYGLMAYVEETFKLRKANKEGYRTKLATLWRWILLPPVASSVIAFSKGYLLFEILKDRP